MKVSSPSRTASGTATAAGRGILVWDAPVRVFHWLMVLCFAGAYLTAEQDGWRTVHVTLGYTMAGLVAFRLVWGLVGTRHARFADFVRGPASVARYLRKLAAGQPEHHTGHNPAGALAILALLGLTLVVAASGWATYRELAGEWLEEFHEFAANAMLFVVGVHVAGVLVGSWAHRENLVRAMVSGRKQGPEQDGVPGARRGVALVILLAVLGFWGYQALDAPGGVSGDRHAGQAVRAAQHDED